MNTTACTSYRNRENPLLRDPHGTGSPATDKASTSGGQLSNKEKKLALLQDVDKLKKRLKHEENIHKALERAFNRPLGALPRLPPYLPPDTLELLAEIAVLEEEVVRLEEQFISYRENLYEEAIYISSKWKEENPVDSNHQISSRIDKEDVSDKSSLSLDRTASNSSDINSDPTEISSIDLLNEKKSSHNGNGHGDCMQDVQGKESRTRSISLPTTNMKFSERRLSRVKTPIRKSSFKRESSFKSTNSPRKQGESRVADKERSYRRTPSSKENKAIGGDSEPNKISEDILKCLCSIFMRLSSRNMKGCQIETFPHCLSLTPPTTQKDFFGVQDPYNDGSDSLERDIGVYKNLCIIDASSIDLKRKRNAVFLLHKLKLLLGKLAKVSLEGLSHQHKLAFWINTYNSCLMNAFLEYGIPDSPEMVVLLMREATIVVGGQTLTAITIEHFILRLPFYLKRGGPKVGKSEELKARSMFGLEWSEPLVTFALSCGSWSSPAVRVYTASQVESELEAAKREYLQAAVGVSKDKKQLIIPKPLDWFLLDFAKDMESLLDWLCLHLPHPLRKEALTILERKGTHPLSQLLHVVPYDFGFRYLLHP